MPVTVYNGQLDLICCTIGAYDWVSMLKWPKLNDFLEVPFKPITVGRKPEPEVALFHRRYENLEFYSVLMAGHMVPSDVPEAAALMLGRILKYQSEAWTLPST